MKTSLVHSIAELRALLAPLRLQGATIGLAPTMGALHAGHGSLIEHARRDCDCVVVSIFVNPIQFNQSDDYQRYPRTLAADTEFCEARAVDFVFAPSEREMYPAPLATHVEVSRLSDHLCGAFRPGHFRGVATVVAKLFSIVQPDRAYFGEKDAQQLAIIRRMVRDLNIPVEIVPVPIVREADGLALSSRNKHLTTRERAIAPMLHQALSAAAEAARSGVEDVGQIRQAALDKLASQPEIRLEYLEIVDPEEMQPVETARAPVLIAVAAWLGETRLIDNVRIG